MGLMDMLGGKPIDTRAAETAAHIARRDAEGAQNRLRIQNQPYVDMGAGASGMLGYLMGLPGYDSVAGKTQTRDEIYRDLYDSHKYLTIPTGSGLHRTDVSALNKEVDQRLAQQGEAIASTDPALKGDLLKKFTMDDYTQSPNYQFNLDEGQKAIDRAAAARGDYLSPEAVKELSAYSQNLASNEFLNSYNIYNQDKASTYDMLMGGTGTGQNAMGVQSQNDTNFTNITNDLRGQQAQLGLASQTDKAAKRASAFNTLVSIAQTAASMGTGMSGGGKFSGIKGSNGMEYMPGWN